MRARTFWVMLFVVLGLVIGVRAQTAEDLDEGIRLEQGAVEGEYTLKWWGKAGRTYFIQASEDLFQWTYLPVIESGADDVIQWGFGASEAAAFLRLKHTDVPAGGNAATADFDGDGVSNQDELLAGFDPLDATSAPPQSPLYVDLPAGTAKIWPYYLDYPQTHELLITPLLHETSLCSISSFPTFGENDEEVLNYNRAITHSSTGMHSGIETSDTPKHISYIMDGYRSGPFPSEFSTYAKSSKSAHRIPSAESWSLDPDDFFDSLGTGETYCLTRLYLDRPPIDRRTWTTCPQIKQYAEYDDEGNRYGSMVHYILFPRLSLAVGQSSIVVQGSADINLYPPSPPSTSHLLPSGSLMSVQRKIVLREVNLLPQSFSLSDSAGPAHRKIGLNGLPLSDAKPQAQDESGELSEETFVDAYSRQLRHSVSDVYVANESTLLPLQVRRSVTPEAWSRRFGLTPDERMDRPFGPGWSSNLTPFITFERTAGDSDSSGAHISRYQRAIVTDEQGEQRVFLRASDGTWHATRQAGQSAKTVFDRLIETDTNPPRFILWKKFGTYCEYQLVLRSNGSLISHSRPNDRYYANPSQTIKAYARMVRTTDRLGNRLVYTYADTADLKSLIPHTIRDPARPAHA